MEIFLPNMKKEDENYKVPNLEKGIAVLEYLSSHSQGKRCRRLSKRLNSRRRPLIVS